MKNIKNTKTTIIMIALVLVVAGTTLAPIQSYATRSGGFPNTSSLKHGIRDGVNVNLEHRDQHMNQENLCYRTNTCRQSNDGQNTLGNDNSITGFADQSDNLKQSAAAPITPSTANQTIANKTSPTPTPTPTTATLTVIKIVNGTTTATPANFTIHVTANNPNPPNFAGSATGTDVTLGPGAFNVTETGLAGFTTSFSSDCSGTIVAGQHLTCTITNTPPTAIPTGCPEGTIFDVTIQEPLFTVLGNLPKGTVFCLQSAGQNTNVLAIIPPANVPPFLPSVTLRGVLVEPLVNGECSTFFFVGRAVLTSGVLPSPLTGTTVCVTVNVI